MLRTHHNGELQTNHVGQSVTLCGWVSVMRDHGGLTFVDLRDRWGTTQVVVNPTLNPQLHAETQNLRSEFCIQIQGKVQKRPQGTENAKLSTGQIEVIAEKLEVFSKSKTPPFELETAENLSEEIRLKYRYLDLRRKSMQKNIRFRSELIFAMRNHLQKKEFIEVETPILTKSTPEGARDYLVPSRVNQGSFFALPQSPQLFKQLLMVSGYDRYFQVAKCFRDEDLRADRQPEFTQLDIEMSFVREKDIYELIESLLAEVTQKMLDIKLTTPFTHLSYADAMSQYGIDKPDLRYDLKLKDVSSSFPITQFKIFKETLDKKGSILALHLPKPSRAFSRKDFDDLTEFVKTCGASGLAYLKITDAGVESPIAKFMTEQELQSLYKSFDDPVLPQDVIFFAAGETRKSQLILGQLRLKLIQVLNLAPKTEYAWCWVDEFPLFQWNEDEKRWDSEHHPFTSPHPDDFHLLGKDNGKIRSLSYDVVLNGNELGSGSVRIFNPEIQQKVFDIIGLKPEESQTRFGFLLTAFQYGPPPHAGIALGIDRLTAIFLKQTSIREVIAFPKTQKAICPLTDAPSVVDGKQLRDLGIRLA